MSWFYVSYYVFDFIVVNFFLFFEVFRLFFFFCSGYILFCEEVLVMLGEIYKFKVKFFFVIFCCFIRREYKVIFKIGKKK